MAGLTATGITIKNVDEIVSDLEAEEIANIDADLNVQADSVAGQLNGIYAAALAECWELLEEVYQSAYPDTASGQSLSYVSALTGAIRQEATKATVEILLIGTVDTVVPAGTQGYVDGDPDSLFETTADATIEEHGVTDYVQVDMQAVTAGSYPKAFITDSALVISTPVSGLTAMGINDDYVPGTDEETDSELRLRREQSLAIAGAATVEAIRAEMLQVTGVDSCTVFENPTGVTDALGLPPKSIEVLVHSITAPAYTAQDVVDEILLRKPAGTQTYGGLSGTATDSSGTTHTVYYSEPTTVRLYVDLTLIAATDGTYVGDTDVQTAVADWAIANLTVGQSVYGSDIVRVVSAIDGVVNVDVGTVMVEDDATPATPDHILTARQLGTIASGDVTVTS